MKGFWGDIFDKVQGNLLYTNIIITPFLCRVQRDCEGKMKEDIV